MSLSFLLRCSYLSWMPLCLHHIHFYILVNFASAAWNKRSSIAGKTYLLDIFVISFHKRFAFDFVDRTRKVLLHQCVWAWLKSLRTGSEQKCRGKKNSSWAGTFIFSCPWALVLWILRLLGSETYINPHPLDVGWITPLTFWFSFTESRLQDSLCLVSIKMWANSHHRVQTFHLLLLLFLWRTLTNPQALSKCHVFDKGGSRFLLIYWRPIGV